MTGTARQDYRFSEYSTAADGRTVAMTGTGLDNGIPVTFTLIAIDHDDYHANRVGRTRDGVQVFVTTPFIPAYGSDIGREFLAVYLFDKSGELLEARIDDLGPSATLDKDQARRLLGEIGEGVRSHTRNIGHVAGMKRDDLAVEVELEFPFDHVKRLVGHAMAVQRRLHAGVGGKVDHRPFAAGVGTRDFHDRGAEPQVVLLWALTIGHDSSFVLGLSETGGQKTQHQQHTTH